MYEYDSLPTTTTTTTTTTLPSWWNYLPIFCLSYIPRTLYPRDLRENCTLLHYPCFVTLVFFNYGWMDRRIWIRKGGWTRLGALRLHGQRAHHTGQGKLGHMCR